MAKPALEKLLLVAFLASLTVILSYSDLLWRFDYWIYDTEIQLLSEPASEDIVIIEVDQQSLQDLGRWPWPRNIHARLMEFLAPAEPYAIALDFVFSEPDAEHPERDIRLDRALAANKFVVLPVIFEQNGSTWVETAPLPDYAAHASLGHANIDQDPDGVSRSILLQAGLGDNWRPAMPLAIYAQRHPEILGKLPGLRTADMVPGQVNMPRGDYRVWLPFYDSQSDFKRLSYRDVLAGAVPRQFFTHKYVLIGLTASGIERTVPAPLTIGGRPMSGVDFIAAGLDGLLKNTLRQPLSKDWQTLVNLLLVCGSALITTRISPRWLPLAILGLAMAILAVSLALLASTHYWLAPASAVCVLIASYPLRSWRHFDRLIHSLFAERKRAYITLNAIVDGVITTTRDGEIDYMNAAAMDIIGNKLATSTSRHIDAIFSVAIDGKTRLISELIEQSISQHSPIKFNHCGLTVSDRFTLTANLNISPMFGSKGLLMGTVLTIHDIGERLIMAKMLLQKSEQQTLMRQLIDRTEQVSLAKSQFLSQMSHELRTPLNAIIGFAQLLQTPDPEYPLAEHHLDSVNEILKAGLHLLGLINELLDLAKIESGKISLSIGSMALTELLSDCQTLIRPLADSKGLQLMIQNPLADDLRLKVDPKRAKQILLNFLSNAVKYNRPGGNITLLTADAEDNRVRISVIDSGQGLAEQQQQLLFQSFERLGAEHTDIEGTGIGLAITKQLAELMQGKVGVTSTPGVGSTFWVELPCSIEQ